MQTTTNYELKTYEGSDLFNPLVVENPNAVTIDAVLKAISDKAVGNATELKTGTVHALTRLNDDADRDVFKFQATSAFTAGDTFTLDGEQVSALTVAGEQLSTGCFIIGSTVLVAKRDTLLTFFVAETTAKDAEKLGGQLPSYYATASALATISEYVTALQDKVGTATLTTTAQDCSGAINELNSKLTDMGKSCSNAVQAPTAANTYVDVTITDPNHSVWVIRCGRRSGWNSYLLAIGTIRWMTSQDALGGNGGIEVQGIADNVLRVTYGFPASSGDTVQVYALK